MSLSDVSDFIEQGDLSSAAAAAAEQVKKNPNDEKIRVLFVEILCVQSEYERADQQLSALLTLKPDLGLTIGVWRHLVKAAQDRLDVFALKAKAELIDEATSAIEHSLDALIALNDEDESRLEPLLAEIDKDTESRKVIVNEGEPGIIRDLDDISANFLEVLSSNGKYFWVDFSQIIELEIHKPERLLDILWRRASIVLSNGTEGEVFIPAIYPTVGDDLAKLGRKTEWQSVLNLYRGVGLKTWLVGEEEKTINDFSSFKANT